MVRSLDIWDLPASSPKNVFLSILLGPRLVLPEPPLSEVGRCSIDFFLRRVTSSLISGVSQERNPRFVDGLISNKRQATRWKHAKKKRGGGTDSKGTVVFTIRRMEGQLCGDKNMEARRVREGKVM